MWIVSYSLPKVDSLNHEPIVAFYYGQDKYNMNVGQSLSDYSYRFMKDCRDITIWKVSKGKCIEVSYNEFEQNKQLDIIARWKQKRRKEFELREDEFFEAFIEYDYDHKQYYIKEIVETKGFLMVDGELEELVIKSTLSNNALDFGGKLLGGY